MKNGIFALVIGTAISLNSFAMDTVLDNKQPLNAITKQEVAPLASATAEVKKPESTFETVKNVATDLAGQIEPTKKIIDQAITEFSSAKTAYEKMCAEHEGELKWYHKAWYGIKAYAQPVISTVVAVVKEVIKVVEVVMPVILMVAAVL